MKMFKGFNLDMTCQGFQFEEGKTYEMDKAILHESGFHACEDPIDCYSYYMPNNSVYHEVELVPTEELSHYDSSRCGMKIKIGKRIGVSDICKAHEEYVKAHCTPVDGNAAGNYESVIAQQGDSAAAGKHGSVVAGNMCGASASVGGSVVADSQSSAVVGCSGSVFVGDYGNAVVGSLGSALAGACGVVAAGFGSNVETGYQGIVSVGNRGSALAGNQGVAAAGNKGCVSVGESGLACCRGGRAKGRLGAVLVLTETDDEGNNVSFACGIVDGKNIKKNTWYKCVNGSLVEA